MTDEQIKKQIEILERVTNEVAKSKKSAKKFLREAGIPVGNEPFGTKPKAIKHA